MYVGHPFSSFFVDFCAAKLRFFTLLHFIDSPVYIRFYRRSTVAAVAVIYALEIFMDVKIANMITGLR